MTDTEYLRWYDDPAGWSAGTDGVKYLIRPHDSLYRAYETSRDAADQDRPGLRHRDRGQSALRDPSPTKHLVR